MAIGKLSGGIVDIAVDMAALGLDPLVFLRTTDDTEKALLMEVYERLVKVKEIQDRNFAIEIANQLGKVLS